MPKMPTTRDIAQGTANAASFVKNMANAGDTSRLRSTGLKGTAVIHNFTDTGNKVGMNHVMELQLLVHVDGRPDSPDAPGVDGADHGQRTRQREAARLPRDADDPASMVIDF